MPHPSRPESDYTAFPTKWNGKEALLEMTRRGTLLTITITTDHVSAVTTLTESEVEELIGALQRIYRNIRMA